MSKLYVVGIGPGDYENMTIRADRVLHACDLIVGYTVYVDLVREHYPDKEYMSTPMTREVERCRMAIEQTICSQAHVDRSPNSHLPTQLLSL